MLGEESASADYWRECGTEALLHGVKHVIIMVRFCHAAKRCFPAAVRG